QPLAFDTQAPDEATRERAVIEVGKPLDRGDERRSIDEAPERDRKLRQVPADRLRLAREGVEAGLVEIGRGKAWVPGRQPTPWAVVEALAGQVHVVRVEHAVDEAGDHVGSR